MHFNFFKLMFKKYIFNLHIKKGICPFLFFLIFFLIFFYFSFFLVFYFNEVPDCEL